MTYEDDLAEIIVQEARKLDRLRSGYIVVEEASNISNSQWESLNKPGAIVPLSKDT